MQARLEHLRAAKGLPHKRPFDVDRRSGNAACCPAFGAAIGLRHRRIDIVCVVDIAAHQRGQRDQLAHPGQPLQIPLRPGKGALGVLPVIAQQRQAVGLKLQVAAQHRVRQPLAEINCGQGERHLSLICVQPQCLGRPAGDRQIGQIGDPFEIDGRSQPVIAAEIVTAQEGAVAGEPDRGGKAPVG